MIISNPSGHKVIIFSMLHSSMKFQLLIQTKILKIKIFLCLIHSDGVFILLINVKMPIIVGILTLMSMINSMLT